MILNPLTKRNIRVGGTIYKKLKRQGILEEKQTKIHPKLVLTEKSVKYLDDDDKISDLSDDSDLNEEDDDLYQW